MASILNATTSTGFTVTPDNSGSLQLATNNGTTAVTIDTSQTTTINSPSSNPLIVQSAGTERMRITSAGDVGIGTSSPSGKLEVSGGQLRVTASSASSMFLVNPSTTYANGVDLQATYNGGGSFGPLKFTTSSTERMRITSDGEMKLGGTGSLFGDNNQQLAITSSTTGLSIQTSGNRSTGFWTNSGSSGTSNAATYCTFFNNSGQQNTGSITSTGTNCLYNNLSDYRLKEDIAPISNGLSLVSALKPVTFKWASNQTEDVGFIAHEFQEVIPNFVTGNKDAVDEEGKPVYQAMDSSGAIPLLVAAIQELKAELDTVKAELASTNLSLADAKAELNTLKNPPVEGVA